MAQRLVQPSKIVNKTEECNDDKCTLEPLSPEKRANLATLAIHQTFDRTSRPHNPVVNPIYLSTTYNLDYPGQENVYDYSRSGNPTREELEKTIAAIENAKHAIAFSSGLGATTSICFLIKSGDHVVVGDDSYGGTNRFFTRCGTRMGIETTFADPICASNITDAIRPNTTMVWLESPTNPTMKIVDIRAVAASLARIKQERAQEIILVVDNTFMSSYFQRPLELGSHIAHQSLTKYINGHSDVVMGAAVTNDDTIAERLRYFQNALGAVPSAFDCYLVKRGVKTLGVRMEAHQRNALAIANYLENHPLVTKVLYPGLPSHPQHTLAKSQCSGFSGMVSFFVVGGKTQAASLVKYLKYFSLAVSLGGVQSLVEIPAVMSHASVSREHCALLGIDESLIRLSVGIEYIDDLIDDLQQALEKSSSYSDKIQ